MKQDDIEKKSDDDLDNPDLLLRGFIGRPLVLIEKLEYQLRLCFGPGIWFDTVAAWRLCQHSDPLVGSGDSPGVKATLPFADLMIGARVVSTTVSESWETKLVFERGYTLEVFPDSVQYETWEAHLEVGDIVFSGGVITLFPPAQAVEGVPSQDQSGSMPDPDPSVV